jgi:hypothetical protein
MANTKKMTREERKAAKRTARGELKKAFLKFSKKQVAEFRGKIKGGIKGFLLGTNQENE